MRDINKVKIDGMTYDVVYNMAYNNRKYVFLMNDSNDEDVLCLKVIESDNYELEKLDSDDELIEVMTEFYRREREELES